MAPSMPNRIQVVGPYSVRIRAVFNSGTGKLLNLSSAGAYVATPMNLLPQAQVRLQIVLPDEKRWIETEAVVAWENRGTVRRGGLPPGYGMRFIKVPDETDATIRRLLENAGQTVVHSEPDVESPQAGFQPLPVATETLRFEIPPELDLDFGVGIDAGAGVDVGADVGADVEPEGPPYRLTEQVIHARTPASAAGIFVLSYDRTQDTFVGRADRDLRSKLLGFIGEYAYFYYENIGRLDERYYRECELYHRLGGDHGQLDNLGHPTPPDGSGLVCPVCAWGATPSAS